MMPDGIKMTSTLKTACENIFYSLWKIFNPKIVRISLFLCDRFYLYDLRAQFGFTAAVFLMEYFKHQNKM